MKASYTAKIQ